jgi:signal transduction histidine kinase
VQRDSWRLLGLALAIGVAIAVLSVGYAGGLERRLHQQMSRSEDLAHDLQGLSAKLVTAQEQERRQIARELHDEIGQALTAIKVELACAGRAIDGGAESGQALQTAKTITDQALHQVRDLSYLLHPAALDEFGLTSAIASCLKSFGRRHEIVTELSHEGMEARLAPETEAAAYRIVQEALTNVAKHAKATECRVHIVRTPELLRIVIEDDGSGFDPSAVRPGERRGLGLIGMRERALYLKGSVTIDSAPVRGTRLTVELPARRASDSGVRAFSPDAPALTGEEHV